MKQIDPARVLDIRGVGTLEPAQSGAKVVSFAEMKRVEDRIAEEGKRACEMQKAILARLSGRQEVKEAFPSGLAYVPQLGQPTPKRAKVTPEVDRVSELLDQKMDRVGGE